MLPKCIISSLITSDNYSTASSLIFQCIKELLCCGIQVHFISNKVIEEMPVSIHGTEKPTVESFSRLSVKYFSDIHQLIDYSCELTHIKSNKRKLPRAVIINELDSYISEEIKGIFALTLLVDALGALGRSFSIPVYLVAGYRTSEISLRSLQSICNFFTSVWKITSINDQESVMQKVNEQTKLKIYNATLGKSVLLISGPNEEAKNYEILDMLS